MSHDLRFKVYICVLLFKFRNVIYTNLNQADLKTQILYRPGRAMPNFRALFGDMCVFLDFSTFSAHFITI